MQSVSPGFLPINSQIGTTPTLSFLNSLNKATSPPKQIGRKVAISFSCFLFAFAVAMKRRREVARSRAALFSSSVAVALPTIALVRQLEAIHEKPRSRELIIRNNLSDWGRPKQSTVPDVQHEDYKRPTPQPTDSWGLELDRAWDKRSKL